MHEWALAGALVKKVVEAAARYPGGKVRTVRVTVGPLAGVSPAELREGFAMAARGSVAEEAQLEVVTLEDGHASEGGGVVIESVEITE